MHRGRLHYTGTVKRKLMVCSMTSPTVSVSALLASKFFRPAPSSRWVTRPHLVQRLTTGLGAGRRIALISAPAGYGKSTLAAEWLAQSAHRTAWLALDASDDQPDRFFTYFVAALRRMDGSFCPELYATLQSGQMPPPDTLTTALVNAMLSWQTSHCLVLDDFHHIQDNAILDVLTAILMHPPPNFRLVLVTREDPPLPLARWRAADQLTELRAADLRFSNSEAAQFLQEGMNLDLSAGEVTRLAERTEGWAAGLQLAGLSLQGRENPGAFVDTLSGSHRFILDYLTEEALKTQPPDVQDFLLETSVLWRLSGGLCDFVTGRSDSADLLERLLAANLFMIPLDDERQWYRYHHLFAELLQHQLRRECADRLPELHQRASLWYEHQDLPAPSIEHALAAGDYPRTAALLGDHGWRLLSEGYARVLVTWAQSLPDEVRDRNPKVNTWIVWGKVLHGEYAQAGPYLAAAQRAVEQLPPEREETQVLQADILALQSIVAQAEGKVSQSLALAESAKALAPAGDMRLTASTSLVVGKACRISGQLDAAIAALEESVRAAQAIDDHVTAMIAMAHLSLIWTPLGRLRLLVEKAAFAIDRVEQIAGVAPSMTGAVHNALGQVYYEWDQIEKARESLLHGLRLASLSGQSAAIIYGRVFLARLHQGEGDLEAAAECMRQADHVLTRGAPGWARPEWIGQQVSLLVAQGRLNEAEAVLRASGVPAGAPVTYQTDVLHLAWLRWMIASRHPDAFSLAERIVRSAETGRRNGTLIYALVVGAKAGGGQAWLARARQLAAPEGYTRVFIDEAYDQEPVISPDLIEQLTERELEVLRLLAEGLTYAQMAELLVVSVNTVRYHVKGVYGKLGVEKRIQAMEKGRNLGLL